MFTDSEPETLPESQRSGEPNLDSLYVVEATTIWYAVCLSPRSKDSIRQERRGWGSSRPRGEERYSQRREAGAKEDLSPKSQIPKKLQITNTQTNHEDGLI